MTFTRSFGNDAVAILFPVETRKGLLFLETFDSEWHHRLMNVRTPGRLANDRPHTVCVRVKARGKRFAVNVRLDGKMILQGEWAIPDLGTDPVWSDPAPGTVSIFFVSSTVTITAARAR